MVYDPAADSNQLPLSNPPEAPEPTEAAPEPPSPPPITPPASTADQELHNLMERFAEIYAITNPIQQEYALTRLARKQEIPLTQCRAMFATYSQMQIERSHLRRVKIRFLDGMV